MVERLLGIDYGSRHIGLAISDPDRIIATPLEVVDAAGSPAGDAVKIAELARKHDITEFVIGLPLNMDGSEGKQAQITRTMGEALARTTSLPVHFFDERFSTYAADNILREAELNRRERGAHLDKVAASIILQAFIDFHRSQAATEDGAKPSPSAPADDIDPPAADS